MTALGRVVIECRPLADLNPAAYNPRQIEDAALAGLGASVARFGVVEPIVWNRRSSNVVGGHQRLRALKAAGVTETDVVVVDLEPNDERTLNLTLNNPAIQGTWTPGALALIEEVSRLLPADVSAALLLPLMSKDVASLLPKAARVVSEDDIPPKPAEPVTKPGDLYRLDQHRILCGDSTNAAHVARLLDGAVPFLMVTDPPYGVSYDPTWRSSVGVMGNVSEGKVANDHRADWTPAWALFPGSVAYVWHGGLHTLEVASSLERAGFERRAQIIWRKQHAPISRGAYHWQHEPAWYVVRKGSTAKWTGDRTETTVWDIASLNPMGGSQSDDDGRTGHGTQKPVECMARPMRNHDAKAVYDPFVGSGSTLIAAERLGRACYAMDIDPAYVDVVVARWERLTGKRAVRETAS